MSFSPLSVAWPKSLPKLVATAESLYSFTPQCNHSYRYIDPYFVTSLYDIKAIISLDPDVLSGQPVFKGTRVPVESLFDYLEAGVSLDEFLDDFRTVTKEHAVAALKLLISY